MIRYELLSFRCFSVLTGLILYNAKCRSLRKWPKLFVFSDPPIMTWFLPRLKYPGAGAAPAWREKLVIVTIRIVFLSQQIQLLLSLLSLLFWLKLIYVMPYSHLFTFWKMRHATLFAWCKGYFSQGHQHKATQYENSNIRIRSIYFYHLPTSAWTCEGQHCLSYPVQSFLLHPIVSQYSTHVLIMLLFATSRGLCLAFWCDSSRYSCSRAYKRSDI